MKTYRETARQFFVGLGGKTRFHVLEDGRALCGIRPRSGWGQEAQASEVKREWLCRTCRKRENRYV